MGGGQERIRALAHYYQSGQSNLASDFFTPCLTFCTTYARAAGYFSSSALKTWSCALPKIVSKEVKIQLIISPVLSSQDKAALRQATLTDERSRLLEDIGDRIMEEVMKFTGDPENIQLRLRLFAWMIANNQLSVKFALPYHVDDPGIYHEKYGIFYFPWADKVAFVGSANESISGHSSNYEKIHVFRSWVQEDIERVKLTESDFEREWSGLAPGLTVVPLSKKALKLIIECAPNKRPEINNGEDEAGILVSQNDPKWRHQEEACSEFLKQGSGIIEMATGTGKTKTALKILSRLIEVGHISGAVITVDGTDLLDQWHQEVLEWVSHQTRPFSVFRQYSENYELQTFVLNPKDAILIISRRQLIKLFKLLPIGERGRLLIIHDEVQGLGSASLCESLAGQHSSFKYRLGLSATPEREYDDIGTKFITNEIGPVIYQFSLEDAIRRGILCEFDYVPLEYDLTDNDKKRLQAVYASKHARAKIGNPMSDEELWIALSKVYKMAEQKPAVFAEFLSLRQEVIKSAIVFVEEKQFGELLLPIIDKYTHLYRTYYDDDDRNNLVAFAKGEIDCLITCHRISQGIDIRNLRCVILFASARAKLETIQRIGRCLRSDPSSPHKRAIVVDFIRRVQAENDSGNSDSDRRLWLTNLSTVTRESEHAN